MDGSCAGVCPCECRLDLWKARTGKGRSRTYRSACDNREPDCTALTHRSRSAGLDVSVRTAQFGGGAPNRPWCPRPLYVPGFAGSPAPLPASAHTFGLLVPAFRPESQFKYWEACALVLPPHRGESGCQRQGSNVGSWEVGANLAGHGTDEYPDALMGMAPSVSKLGRE